MLVCKETLMRQNLLYTFLLHINFSFDKFTYQVFQWQSHFKILILETYGKKLYLPNFKNVQNNLHNCICVFKIQFLELYEKFTWLVFGLQKILNYLWNISTKFLLTHLSFFWLYLVNRDCLRKIDKASTILVLYFKNSMILENS